ncbi:MAG: M10 family metallopeptidase [Heliomarina sp.]|uniref:M10 family metallopeptidase n=1 Tax=Heliomarina sp. TaxID=2917556 RepID=UPI004058ABD8
MSGLGHSIISVLASGDARIDGLLYESAWADNKVTYAFPAGMSLAAAPYGAGEAEGIFSASGDMQSVVAYALDADNGLAEQAGFAVSGFTKLEITQTVSDGSAHINVAQTSEDPYNFNTAWGYFPSTSATAGDVWLTNKVYNYADQAPGQYAHVILQHELGHVLGLDHGHSETAHGTVPSEYDTMEYSIMTYRSYEGADALRYYNHSDGYAQSWMMLDIAALQHLYGADFDANAGDTVYRWDPEKGETMIDGKAAIAPATNKIFATIWDGDGTDTYDLSAYRKPVDVDLAPGGHSLFSLDQAAGLGNGNYASGNIYNALQYDGDARSLIENAIGGRGDDAISGNSADNRLKGNSGKDELFGFDGRDKLIGNGGRDILDGGNARDKLIGGGGKDTLIGGNGRDVLRGGNGDDTLIGNAGRDKMIGMKGADTFLFLTPEDSGTTRKSVDRIINFSSGEDTMDFTALSAASVDYEDTGKKSFSVFVDIDGDGAADMQVDLLRTDSFGDGDFLF